MLFEDVVLHAVLPLFVQLHMSGPVLLWRLCLDLEERRIEVDFFESVNLHHFLLNGSRLVHVDQVLMHLSILSQVHFAFVLLLDYSVWPTLGSKKVRVYDVHLWFS